MNSILGLLKQFDTPTICNALELVDPNRRNFGYSTRNFFALNTHLGSICGIAKTATCRSLEAPRKEKDEIKSHRLEYYKYVSNGSFPKVAIMQDLDGPDSARGPFWGEFNVRIHRAMGCVGIITDGSVRDVASLPDDILILGHGLRPSHANIHVCDFNCPVTLYGMVAGDGDIIHADVHGAVCFPLSLAQEVLRRAYDIIESERPIIEACKVGSLDFETLRRLYLNR